MNLFIIVAVLNEDFQPDASVQQITFTSGQSSSSKNNTQCIDIPIVDDSIYEGPVNETFTVLLQAVDSKASVQPSSATVSIMDNDSENECEWNFMTSLF